MKGTVISMLSLYLFVSLFFSSQQAFAQIKPDTTYHAATQTIKSITEYNADTTVKKYSEFYVNGSLSYYITYEYSAGALTKENYFDANGQLTAYGEYVPNTIGGKDYNYYLQDGTLLSTTQFSKVDTIPWQKAQYKAFSAPQNIRYRIVYTYENNWLKTEQYLDHNDSNYATGTWSWYPADSLTAYTFTVNNKKWFDQTIGGWYNKYILFYHGNSTAKDSLYVINDSATVYKALYEYNADGWMIKDKYYNAQHSPTYHGEYSFDPVTYQTTYKFFSDSSSKLLYESIYNYKGQYEHTKYYSHDTLDYLVRYTYNSGGYYQKVTKEKPVGTVVSYETYEYYEPYYYLKKYTTYNANDSVTSYYCYDINGTVTDSSVTILASKKTAGNSAVRFVCKAKSGGKSLIIRSKQRCRVALSVYTVDGQRIVSFKDHLLQQGVNYLPLTAGKSLACGIYYYTVTTPLYQVRDRFIISK